jgi:hypothetical protein
LQMQLAPLQYGAAIIAMQRGGRKPEGRLAQVVLEEGDSIVLQAQEESPLLAPPPADLFDENGGGENSGEEGGEEGSGGDGFFSPVSSRWRMVGGLYNLSSIDPIA